MILGLTSTQALFISFVIGWAVGGAVWGFYFKKMIKRYTSELYEQYKQ